MFYFIILFIPKNYLCVCCFFTGKLCKCFELFFASLRPSLSIQIRVYVYICKCEYIDFKLNVSIYDLYAVILVIGSLKRRTRNE